MAKLYKSINDKKLMGVCSGIAEHFGFNVTLLRILWLISVLGFGTGIFLYIVAAILMPVPPGVKKRGPGE